MKTRSTCLALLLVVGCGDDSAPPAGSDTDGDDSTSTSPVTSVTTPTATSPSTTDPTTGPDTTGGTDPETGSSSTGGSDSTSSTGGTDSGSSSTGVDGVTIPFTLTNFADNTAFADVDVCFLENSSCDVSDMNGEGEIVGPADTNLTIDVQNGGVFPSRFPVRFDDTGLDAFIATLTQTDVGLVFLALGYDEVPPQGTIAMLVVDENGEGLAGATVNVDVALEAPIYFDNAGPDPALTATDAGLGIFVEVPEGDYEVWVEHPDYDCLPAESAWPASEANRAALTVVDGIITIPFAFECTPSA